LKQPGIAVEVYVVKVTLLGTSPPVWRRILVPRDITLQHLHRTLQTVMGWTNSHLHQFVVQRRTFSDPRSRGGTKVTNENRTRLGELIWTVGASLLYEYDFGDGWRHQLLLEEVLTGDESFQQMRRGKAMLSTRRLWRATRICRASQCTSGRQSPRSRGGL